MPIYEYKCHSCEQSFEAITTMAKADHTPCSNCGSSETERLLSVFGVGAAAQPAMDCSGGSCQLPQCQPSAGMCGMGGCPPMN